MYVPGAEYAWVAVAPVAVPPSPKVQLKVYGGLPPEAEPVKVMVWPALGDAGLELKLGVGVETCILHPVSGCSSHPENEWSCAEQQLGPSQ